MKTIKIMCKLLLLILSAKANKKGIWNASKKKKDCKKLINYNHSQL